MRSVIAILSGALLLAACGADEPTRPAAALGARAGAGVELRHATIDDGPHDVAVLTIRDLGTIRIELLPEVAPKTVENFVKLANEGFYDRTKFHRVIPGFMIQGGDPNTRGKDPRTYGKGGPGYKIPDEFSDLPHNRGAVSMANAGVPNTGASQFFIVHGDATHLDGRHTVFGRVIEGMDVADAITELEIDTYGRYGPRNRPHPVSAVVESVRIEPAGSAAGEAGQNERERKQTEREREQKEWEGPDGDAEAGAAIGS
jgi:cyclophilin family peptidyl-prolyl cis-trans isomerase